LADRIRPAGAMLGIPQKQLTTRSMRLVNDGLHLRRAARSPLCQRQACHPAQQRGSDEQPPSVHSQSST